MKYNFEELKDIVKSKMSNKRFAHTLGVVQMAEKLAIKYGADIEKVRVAALLHDICKEMEIDLQIKICRDFFKEEIGLENLDNKEILHSFVGSYWVEKNLYIDDRDILLAIKNHTLGDEKMSLIEKIVYLADGIELGRSYPSVDKIRKMAFENLDKAILFELDKKEEFLKTIGKNIHIKTKLFRESLEKI